MCVRALLCTCLCPCVCLIVCQSVGSPMSIWLFDSCIGQSHTIFHTTHYNYVLPHCPATKRRLIVIPTQLYSTLTTTATARFTSSDDKRRRQYWETSPASSAVDDDLPECCYRRRNKSNMFSSHLGRICLSAGACLISGGKKEEKHEY